MPEVMPAAQASQVLFDEAQFANQFYSQYEDLLDINLAMFQKYAAPADLSDWRQFASRLLGDLEGQRLLDLGCGMGEEAVYFAKLGADVTAIDISEVGIRLARQRAMHNQVRINAQVMACPTTLPAGSFDLIHGLGIVHHVGLDAALRETLRLLRPGGRAIFLEPMGNCRSLERFKRWLRTRLAGRMKLAEETEHERPLRWQELAARRGEFSRYEMVPYHLLFRVRKLLPRRWRRAAQRLDYRLLRWAPWLKHFAGGVVLVAEKPDAVS